MPYFNWDELDLEHRRYVCILAGVHESYAILRLRDFHERAGLRDGGSRTVLDKITTAGTRWASAVGGYWLADTYLNVRGRWVATPSPFGPSWWSKVARGTVRRWVSE